MFASSAGGQSKRHVPEHLLPQFCGVRYDEINDTFISDVEQKLSEMDEQTKNRQVMKSFYLQHIGTNFYVLHTVVTSGREDVLSFLLSLLANNPLKSSDDEGSKTLLCKAGDFGIESLTDGELTQLPHPIALIASGKTVLFLAATENKTELVKLLISSGADVNQKVSFWGGVPLLNFLVVHGVDCSETLSALIQAKDIDFNKEETNPLCVAVEHAKVEYVEMLYKAGADVNKTPTGQAMLALVGRLNDGQWHEKARITSERQAMCNYLLSLAEPTIPVSRRLNIFARDDETREGVLAGLARFPQTEEFVTKLLKLADRLEPRTADGNEVRGAARLLTARSAGGMYPLQKILQDGLWEPSSISVLVNYEYSIPIVDLTNTDGTTAVQQVDDLPDAVFGTLLSVGASVNGSIAIDSKTPLRSVIATENLNIYSAQQSDENQSAKILQLLDCGADLGWTCPQTGQNLGHIAIRYASECWPILQTLKAEGLDFNAKDNEGLTLIHTAAIKGYSSVIKGLANYCDPNVRDNIGQTAVHKILTISGAEDNQYETLRDLGMDINATDNDGNTPLHLAVINKNNIIVPFLIVAGADKTLLNHQGESPIAIAERLHSTVREPSTLQANALLGRVEHDSSSLLSIVVLSKSECIDLIKSPIAKGRGGGLFSGSNANTGGQGGLYSGSNNNNGGQGGLFSGSNADTGRQGGLFSGLNTKSAFGDFSGSQVQGHGFDCGAQYEEAIGAKLTPCASMASGQSGGLFSSLV